MVVNEWPNKCHSLSLSLLNKEAKPCRTSFIANPQLHNCTILIIFINYELTIDNTAIVWMENVHWNANTYRVYALAQSDIKRAQNTMENSCVLEKQSDIVGRFHAIAIRNGHSIGRLGRPLLWVWVRQCAHLLFTSSSIFFFFWFCFWCSEFFECLKNEKKYVKIHIQSQQK